MNTANAHRWAITNIGGETHPEAWTRALAAGRAALLAGELDTLAITVDDEDPAALYSPARDERGALDPADVTAVLVEIHQNATAAMLADRLVAGP
jgi:hypothetical protein